jgi:hypothetical protein
MTLQESNARLNMLTTAHNKKRRNNSVPTQKKIILQYSTNTLYLHTSHKQSR